MSGTAYGPPPTYVESGIDGFLLPFSSKGNNFQDFLKYRPLKDDTYLVTYPKCGTTYLQQILYLIYHDGVPATNTEYFFKSTPFLEKGLQYVTDMPRPNAIKSHLPYSLIPYSDEVKYIYMARNPKDCVVSMFHHTVQLPFFNFTHGIFDQFFELFLSGEVEFGNYFDHLLSWYEHRNDPNVLFLHYEEFMEDPASNVIKIGTFLGGDYANKIKSGGEFLNNILQYSSFDFMKVQTNNMYKEKHQCEVTRVRKGKVGGWRETMSEDQNERLDKIIEKRLAHTDIIKFWKQKLCI